MGYSFNVTECLVAPSEWKGVLDSLESEFDFFQAPAMAAHIRLHARGGIRGALVEFAEDGEGFEITLNTFANRGDFRLAAAFLRRAVGAGGGTIRLDEGEEVTVDALTNEWADAQADKWFLFGVNMVRSAAISSPDIKVPIGNYALAIDPAEIPRSDDGIPTFEANLAVKVAKYSGAFQASLMQLKRGAELQIVSALPPLPTIVSARTQFLMIAGYAPSIAPLLSIAKAKEILGDHLEELGSGYYFDGIQLADHPTLHKQIAEAIAAELGIPGERVLQ